MTTDPQQTDPHETTPPEGEQTGTTPPAAEPNAGTTPPAEGGNEGKQPDIDKIVQKRLDRERKKWEAERTEAEKRARMDEAERAKAEAEDIRKELEEARAEARRERTIRSLTGKTVDAEDALAIAERLDLVTDDGIVDVDKLLAAKPYLAPQQAGKPGVTPANAASSKDGALSPEDFKGKSAEWINANWHRIKR